jgi:fructose-bisphosphate aldolase class II
MPLTLRQIRKNCEDARASFSRARDEHFALGAFNLDNQETLIAVAKAAANKKVEAEPHYFGGSSNVHEEQINYEEIKKTFSTPEGARAFIDATKVDTFAAAVGNLHGKYPVPKMLDLELLQRIRDAIGCNISLHGGSDTPAHYFIEAVKIGVTKININSDMRYAYRQTLEKALNDNKTEYAVVKLMGQVIEEVQKVVESKIDTFNSSGKAQPK